MIHCSLDRFWKQPADQQEQGERLQLAVGFYVMTSKFLETFDIDMQPVEQLV